MFGLRQTVSLLLISLGGLLILLAGTAFFLEPPRDVSADIARLMTTLFLLGGAIGMGIFAWGVYLRSSLSRGATRTLWATYATMLAALIGLAAFVWWDISRAVTDIAISGRMGRVVVGTLFFFGFLFGPILKFARRPGGMARKWDESGEGN